MISKKLTSKAGITIPKALRADLGWQPSMAVDLAPQEDGSLIIRPHIDLCRFCGTHENVHKYKDVCVCSESQKIPTTNTRENLKRRLNNAKAVILHTIANMYHNFSSRQER